MTQPKLRPTNKPARLSSKGGNVWVKTIYIVPERPNDRAVSYGSVYGRTQDEATANAARFVRLHNAGRKLPDPGYTLAQAQSTIAELQAFAATRSDIDATQPIIPQLIKLLSNGN